MDKLELKHIAPYLPYGLKCEQYGEAIGLRDWLGWGVEFKDKAGSVHVPLRAVKPILRPLSALTIQEFGDIVKDAYNLKDVVTFQCYDHTMWVCPKEEDYYIWEDGDAEYMAYKEEDDSEAVVSMGVYPNGTPRMDLAFGRDDEYRYFIPYDQYDNIKQEFLKRHFDLFGLLKSGLAIDSTKLEGGNI